MTPSFQIRLAQSTHKDRAGKRNQEFAISFGLGAICRDR
jgi:hypothetical protein